MPPVSVQLLQYVRSTPQKGDDSCSSAVPTPTRSGSTRENDMVTTPPLPPLLASRSGWNGSLRSSTNPYLHNVRASFRGRESLHSEYLPSGQRFEEELVSIFINDSTSSQRCSTFIPWTTTESPLPPTFDATGTSYLHSASTLFAPRPTPQTAMTAAAAPGANGPHPVGLSSPRWWHRRSFNHSGTHGPALISLVSSTACHPVGVEGDRSPCTTGRLPLHTGHEALSSLLLASGSERGSITASPLNEITAQHMSDLFISSLDAALDARMTQETSCNEGEATTSTATVGRWGPPIGSASFSWQYSTGGSSMLVEPERFFPVLHTDDL